MTEKENSTGQAIVEHFNSFLRFRRGSPGILSDAGFPGVFEQAAREIKDGEECSLKQMLALARSQLAADITGRAVEDDTTPQLTMLSHLEGVYAFASNSKARRVTRDFEKTFKLPDNIPTRFRRRVYT